MTPAPSGQGSEILQKVLLQCKKRPTWVLKSLSFYDDFKNVNFTSVKSAPKNSYVHKTQL